MTNGRLNEYVPVVDAERFAAHEKFFLDDVGQWVRSRFGVGLPAERTAVWGASLGGELAIAMGLRHPDVYGAVFSASPGGGYRPPAVLPSRFRASTSSRGRKRSSSSQCDALGGRAARCRRDVVMMEREGGHGGAFWGEEFPIMVAWAFGR